MQSSGATFWSPGPPALAIPAELGETISKMEWREALRDRLDELGESLVDPVRTLEEEWMSRTGNVLGLQTPGDLVDHPEFVEELQRHDLTTKWPVIVKQLLEEGTEPQDLMTWVAEMLPALRD